MAVNKVEYGNRTLIDLTSDTVSANTLAKDVTAHDKAGNLIVGEMEAEAGGEYDAMSVSNGDGTQTLKITTVGSGATATDPIILTKTFVVNTNVSNSSYASTYIFSSSELIGSGLIVSGGNLSDTWNNYSVDLRAVSLVSDKTNQFLRAYTSNAPTIRSEDQSDGSFMVSVRHTNSSATQAYITAFYVAVTQAASGCLFEFGSNVKLSVDTSCVLTQGTYVATIMAWGRKQ